MPPGISSGAHSWSTSGLQPKKAARGTDGRKYPWGNDVGTAPVGSFSAGASAGGALDLIGNVGEWTTDPYSDGHAVRGGSFYHSPSYDRASARLRGGPDSRAADVGFRCVK